MDKMITQHPILLAYFCGLLCSIVLNQKTILILSKSNNQRSEKEKYEIKNGLFKALLLELLIFVPASISLFWLAVFPLIQEKLLILNNNVSTWAAFVGLIGYGFPFVTFRELMKKIALRTLEEFANIAKQHEDHTKEK